MLMDKMIREVGKTESARLPEAERINLYATPVVKHSWPDSEKINNALREVILARRNSTSGIKVTNAGGWHSDRNLQSWQEACVVELVNRIHLMVREMVHHTVPNVQEKHLTNWKLEAWANVNGYGHYNKPHVHTRDGNLWSGIYYVDPGENGHDRPYTGLTRFQDRSGVPKEIMETANPFDREHVIYPQPGLMVMFPGTLYHSVDPLLSPGPRITIAFNLSHPGFTIPQYEPNDWWWTNFRGLMKLRERMTRWVPGGDGSKATRS